jgi:hypothetical protein
MSRLFDPDLVYPSDEVGPFTELTGVVVSVGEPLGEEVRVDVYTHQGIFSAFTLRPPKVGYMATVRIYDSGGGWYPDDRIVRWARPSNYPGDSK